MTIPFPSGAKTYCVTPTRERAVKQVVKRRFSSAVNTLQKHLTSDELTAHPGKKMIDELKDICRMDNNSVLLDVDKPVKIFSRSIIWL